MLQNVSNSNLCLCPVSELNRKVHPILLLLGPLFSFEALCDAIEGTATLVLTSQKPSVGAAL